MLKRIPTPSGLDAYHRMKTCGLRFDHARSWLDDIRVAPQKGRSDDVVLQVTFSAPRRAGQKRRDEDIIAQWRIPKSGQPTPGNAWADKIQNADQVMWIHC